MIAHMDIVLKVPANVCVFQVASGPVETLNVSRISMTITMTIVIIKGQ